MIELSVIIPCYNTRFELLDRCINSVLTQNIDEYEIIIIDDGSDIEYRPLYRRIAEKDERISIITKDNGGASSARNYGVAIAKGKYVTFVDSDDELLADALYEGIRFAQQYNADFVIGANALRSGEVVHMSSPKATPVVIDGYANEGNISKSYLSAHMLGRIINYPALNGQIGRGPVSRIIRKEYAEIVPFDNRLVIGEDVKWNLELIEKCKNIILVEQVWYKYHFNEASITHKYRENALEIANMELKELGLYIDLSDDVQYESYCVRILQALDRIFDTCLGHPDNKMRARKKREIIRYLYREYPWRMIRETRFFNLTDNTCKIKLFLYRIHLYFAVRRMRKLFK